jgi:hypothetical protein
VNAFLNFYNANLAVRNVANKHETTTMRRLVHEAMIRGACTLRGAFDSTLCRVCRVFFPQPLTGVQTIDDLMGNRMTTPQRRVYPSLTCIPCRATKKSWAQRRLNFITRRRMDKAHTPRAALSNFPHS